MEVATEKDLYFFQLFLPIQMWNYIWKWKKVANQNTCVGINFNLNTFNLLPSLVIFHISSFHFLLICWFLIAAIWLFCIYRIKSNHEIDSMISSKKKNSFFFAFIFFSIPIFFFWIDFLLLLRNGNE